MFDEIEVEQNFLPAGYIISERYELVKLLGTGGMGSVYLACDRLLENNHVAVKVLHSAFANDVELTRRFLREVRITHLVNHANVVRTYDVGKDGPIFYFTMEHVSGVPLDETKLRGRIGVEDLQNIIIQLCNGLAAIHDAQIVHRDLKPANVLIVDDNLIKITDFGVARQKSSAYTSHDRIIGSIEYIAPEVWEGKTLTPAVDFYSLGVILYELVTGHVPFTAEDPATIMWLHLSKDPVPPKVYRPDLPEWVSALILKLMAKSPKGRPRNSRSIISYMTNPGSADEMVKASSVWPTIGQTPVPYYKLSHVFRSSKSGLQNTAYSLSRTNSTSLFVYSADAGAKVTGSAGAELIARGIAEHSFSHEGAIGSSTLVQAFADTNDLITTQAPSLSHFSQLRLAAASIAIHEDRALIAYVGDCNIFLVSGNQFFRLSEPEKVYATLENDLSLAEWCMGTSDVLHVERYVLGRTLSEGDRLVFVSPGFSSVVEAAEIGKVIASNESRHAADCLIELAQKRAPSMPLSVAIVSLVDFEDKSLKLATLRSGEMQLLVAASALAPEEERPLTSIGPIPYVGEEENFRKLNSEGRPFGLDVESDQFKAELRNPFDRIIFAEQPTNEEITVHQEVFQHQRGRWATNTNIPRIYMPRRDIVGRAVDNLTLPNLVKAAIFMFVAFIGFAVYIFKSYQNTAEFNEFIWKMKTFDHASSLEESQKASSEVLFCGFKAFEVMTNLGVNVSDELLDESHNKLITEYRNSYPELRSTMRNLKSLESSEVSKGKIDIGTEKQELLRRKLLLKDKIQFLSYKISGMNKKRADFADELSSANVEQHRINEVLLALNKQIAILVPAYSLRLKKAYEVLDVNLDVLAESLAESSTEVQIARANYGEAIGSGNSIRIKENTQKLASAVRAVAYNKLQRQLADLLTVLNFSWGLEEARKELDNKVLAYGDIEKPSADSVKFKKDTFENEIQEAKSELDLLRKQLSDSDERGFLLARALTVTSKN